MSLTLHKPGQHIGLGMNRVEGSLPAKKAAQLVRKKLTNYNILLEKDIFAGVTDGVSVMKKVERLMGITHQLCHSHEIHLAVIDVLYEQTAEQEEEDDEEDADEKDDGNESAGEVKEAGLDEDGWPGENPSSEIEIAEDFCGAIKKIRKLASMFQRSPVRNHVLQKIIKEEKGKNDKEKDEDKNKDMTLPLVIDMKTRWNSLLPMLKRYMKLKNCVTRPMLKLALRVEMLPSPRELALVKEVVAALVVVEAAALASGRRNSDLLEAEGALEFMLQQQLCDISMKLHKAILKRTWE